MKNKFIVLMLVIGLLFLGSCDTNKYEKINTTYKEADLENISLYVTSLDLTLDLSNDTNLKELLLSLEVYKDKSNIVYEEVAEYILNFGNYEFIIYGFNSIKFIDNDVTYDACTLNNEFDYLNTLFDFNELNFDSYTTDQKIKVYNSKNDSAEITNKADFLNKLSLIKYIKLKNKEIFTLGDLKYKIEIAEDVISVYEKYITINNELYILTDGDFAFLSSLKYSSSSGWLPWI